MRFRLTDAQEAFRLKAREFAERELAPRAAEVDRAAAIPESSIRGMAALGLFGVCVPVEYGGLGLDTVSYAAAMEEVSRACASTGVMMTVNNSLAAWPLTAYGTHGQKARFLTPMARGEKLGAFCLTEPGSGSDAGSLSTTAVRDGGGWLLNGTKAFVSNGAIASTYIVFVSGDRAKGTKGVHAFVVPRDAAGVSIGKMEKKLGIRGSDCTEVILDSCRLPADALLAKEGDGFRVAMSTLDGGRIGIAAQAVGIAQAALDFSLGHIRGHPDAAKSQAAQFHAADIATEVEAARLLVHRAAHTKDAGQRCSREAAAAKLFASEAAVRCATTAVRLAHDVGGTGRNAAERLLRDAKITEIYEGTSEVQQMVLAHALGL